MADRGAAIAIVPGTWTIGKLRCYVYQGTRVRLVADIRQSQAPKFLGLARGSMVRCLHWLSVSIPDLAVDGRDIRIG